MKKINFKTLSFNIALLIITVLSLSWVGIYNGLPLVYPDTGAYINSGFENKVPIDRPILYGLFIRHISFAETLWLISIVQALLLIYISNLTYKIFLPKKNSFIYTSIALILLSFISSISYFSSQIMPDFFTGILLLSLMVIVWGEKKHLIPSSIICILSSGMHYSHLPILSACSVFLIVCFLRSTMRIQILKELMVLNLSAWLFLPLLHFCFGYGFHLSKASHVFLMGRLAESGVLYNYLQEACPENNFQICEFKDRLPVKAEDLWWRSDSPLYNEKCMESNGEKCWLEKKEEYASIINNSLSQWKYLKPFIGNCLLNTRQQLTTIHCPEIPSMMEGSPVWGQMNWHYKREFLNYIHTKQAESQLHFYWYNIIMKISYAISLILLLFYLLKKELRKKYWFFIAFILFAVCANAAICSSLSCVADRYQSRVIWIIPLAAILILISIILDKHETQNSHTDPL